MSANPVLARQLRWAYLGRQPYGPTWALQERLRQGLREGRQSEHLLLLEHSPVYTLGKNAKADDILADPAWLAQHGIEIQPTNRGGKVTYHGPGQLVGYPILDLRPDRCDVRRFVQDLLDVLVATLADFGVSAHRGEEQALIGVWVGEAKIASLGVHLARWITLHGFALNVTTELAHFQGIVACGLPAVKMTSLAELLEPAPPLPEVAARVAFHLARIFARELVATAPHALLAEVA